MSRLREVRQGLDRCDLMVWEMRVNQDSTVEGYAVIAFDCPVLGLIKADMPWEMFTHDPAPGRRVHSTGRFWNLYRASQYYTGYRRKHPVPPAVSETILTLLCDGGSSFAGAYHMGYLVCGIAPDV